MSLLWRYVFLALSVAGGVWSFGAVPPNMAYTTLTQCHAWTCRASNAMPPNTAARALPALAQRPYYPCLAGEKWPRPKALKTRGDEIQERRLNTRVQYLETLVQDLCSAIVYSDDMALVERQMLQCGNIHLDMSSNMTRTPLLLRRAVADIARANGKPVRSPAHNWA
jgi:hypothetical protein